MKKLTEDITTQKRTINEERHQYNGNKQNTQVPIQKTNKLKTTKKQQLVSNLFKHWVGLGIGLSGFQIRPVSGPEIAEFGSKMP